jgi:hypothetical protein
MRFRQNLRRARSHLITIVVLLIAGTIIVRIEDRNLAREIGKPKPDHSLPALGSGGTGAP